MAKKKLLTSLLCVALVSPLAACNKNPDNSSNTNNNSEQVLEDINKAAVATKNKLVEELNKDTVSLKFDVDYSAKESANWIEEQFVLDENATWQLTNTETTPENFELTETAEVVANIDNKYYTDFVNTQGSTTLKNGTAVFAKVDATQKENGESASSKVEALIKDGTATARMQSGEYVQETSSDFSENDAGFAQALASVKQIATFTEEQALAFFGEMLKGSVDMEGETFDAIFNAAVGFIDGTKTSKELVDVVLPVLAGGEEIPEDMSNTYVALLDYVKTVETNTFIKYTSSENDGETVATLTFDYAGFKTFVSKVFDDLTAIFVENVKADSTEEIKSSMEATEEQLFGMLPDTVNLSVSFGIRNNIFSSFEVNCLVDGMKDMSKFGTSQDIPVDENGNPIVGATTSRGHTAVTKVEFNAYVGFEFGTSAYTIPEFSISAPVAQ